MTVHEFLSAYFGLGSKVQGILVQRNNLGELERLYTADNGYDERFIKPEVRTAVIYRWGVRTSKPAKIWVVVE